MARLGLYIWHIDASKQNNDEMGMTPSSHWMVSLEQADGKFHLETSLNPLNRYGDAGDSYRAGYVTSFTPATIPDTNLWSGEPSEVSITNIGPLGNTMQYNVDLPKKSKGTEITFDPSFKVTGDTVTGLNHLDTSVKNMKSKISSDFIIEFYNYKGELLDDTGSIGTGSKIVFKNTDNSIAAEYNVVLYGDVNGDGRINSVDLLILQRHILKIEPFVGMFLKSGNIMKDGKNPSSVDSLKIQRHILKLEVINQSDITTYAAGGYNAVRTSITTTQNSDNNTKIYLVLGGLLVIIIMVIVVIKRKKKQ